jgi:hypothetical protein
MLLTIMCEKIFIIFKHKPNRSLQCGRIRKIRANCDVIKRGSPVFRRRVAPRPGSVLIILSKNIVKNTSVWPAPSPRGHTLGVIGTGFLTHYAYAYTHYVTCLAFSPYFTVGSMTYEFLFYMML